MSGPRSERRRRRVEKRYRRLLALYPKDHRREHAEEMVGVRPAPPGSPCSYSCGYGGWPGSAATCGSAR